MGRTDGGLSRPCVRKGVPHGQTDSHFLIVIQTSLPRPLNKHASHGCKLAKSALFLDSEVIGNLFYLFRYSASPPESRDRNPEMKLPFTTPMYPLIYIAHIYTVIHSGINNLQQNVSTSIGSKPLS